MQLSPHIFWDLEVNSINFQQHARLVIERVVRYGSLADWHQLKAFYGIHRIKKEAVEIRTLDKKTLNFLSVILEIPKVKFRCYKQTQSTTTHWNY